MNREIKIVSVGTTSAVRDVGALAAKVMPACHRYRYIQDVRYTLEDGQVIDSQLRGLTKPKLAKNIQSAAEAAANGSSFAQRSSYDNSWVFIRKLLLGA
jgi:hypothetical protein